MARAHRPANPFAHRSPKPKVVALIKLITPRQRGNYHRLARSLKRLPGVHAELNYFGKEWGWALRYRRGDAALCTLHFLPSKFEATITVPRKMEDWALGPNHISGTTKREIRSLRKTSSRMLRMPLGTPRRGVDLARMIRFKVTDK